jgi:threonine synthase
MVVVQAEVNSPIASAMRKGSGEIIPFRNFTTLAEALSSGNPPGGEEILAKAREFGWLPGEASEEEILESQRLYARAGFFVEPGTATTLAALRKLRASGAIRSRDRVVVLLTGSGMKDMDATLGHPMDIVECGLEDLKGCVSRRMRG